MKNHPIRVPADILLKHALFLEGWTFSTATKQNKETNKKISSWKEASKTKTPQVRTGGSSKWGRYHIVKETSKTSCEETHPNESCGLCLCFLCFLHCFKTKFENSHQNECFFPYQMGTHCRILKASKGRKKPGKSVWPTNGWRWLGFKWKAFLRASNCRLCVVDTDILTLVVTLYSMAPFMQSDVFVKLRMEQNKFLPDVWPFQHIPCHSDSGFSLYKLQKESVVLPGCLLEFLVTGRCSPAQVMGYWPCKLDTFGLENHLRGTVTLAGLSLTHSSLWYWKGRLLMDHNLFILIFKKSAPSKERSGCVYDQMKHLVWTMDTCAGVKQKRPLLPIWISLQAKAEEEGWDTAGLVLRPRGLQI